MLAKQLDDALCSGGTGDWRGRAGKCASCYASGGTARATASRTNGTDGTESQPMSLLAELEQAEAAHSQASGASPEMVDVDLTEHRTNGFTQPEMDVERWAVRLCDVLDRQRNLEAGSRPLELSADTRYRLLKLISSGDDGKPAGSTDLAELVRNRDGRVAELTCEVHDVVFTI